MAQTDIHDALVKSEFDFQGRLGNFLISDLLQMIQLSGKTGTLTLLQGWNNRTITFEKGRISYVASGSRLPSQFDLLVRTGRLTRHQVEAFRQRRPGKTEEEMIDELITRKLLDRAAIETLQRATPRIRYLYPLPLAQLCVHLQGRRGKQDQRGRRFGRW